MRGWGYEGLFAKYLNVRTLSLLLLFLGLRIGFLRPVASMNPTVNLSLWTHERYMADLTYNLINEFNATVGREKGIHVSIRLIGGNSDSLFQNSQLKNNGPDIYSNFVTGYTDKIRSGSRICLDGLPGFKKWKSSWPSWYWREGLTTYQGMVYGIPARVFNSRLIYNRDLFREIGRDPDRPPRSYVELKTIAREITIKTKRKAYGFAYCGEDWTMYWMLGQWAEANGTPTPWDWKHGRVSIMGYYPVLKLLEELERGGTIFPGPFRFSIDALRVQFAEGRIGMLMGECWDIGVLTGQFPAKCDWGVGSIPTYDGEFHGKTRAMLMEGWCINGQSRFKRQAWEVMKWLSRYETRAKMVERGAIIDPDPVVRKYYVKKSIKVKGYNQFAMTLEQDYLTPFPNLPGWEPPKCSLYGAYRMFLIHGTDLKKQLFRMEQLCNNSLQKYYLKHPEIRGWNTYPQFDPLSGRMGPPLVEPDFKTRDHPCKYGRERGKEFKRKGV